MINSLSLKILFLYGNLQIKFEDLSTFKGFQISLKPHLFRLLYFDLLSYCMTYTCVYVYMYSRPRLYVCVCLHVYVCICMCIYMPVRVDLYLYRYGCFVIFFTSFILILSFI